MIRFEDGQHIHLVGVGGYGISAIARILLERGFSVSGSDRNANSLTEALKRDGATIYHGHAAEYVNGAHLLIISSAIPDDHVELVAAREHHIPIYKRRDILAALMQDQRVIAVAGTHGKTTTTSMIVHILRETGNDPSYIVGGEMPATGTNAGVGNDDVFVIEADEYDYMFHGLQPDIAVITSIEYDHPDFFKDWADLQAAFRDFVDLLPDDGILIGCGDDAATEQLLRQQIEAALAAKAVGKPARTMISYGVDFLDFVDVLGWHQRIDADGFMVFDVDIEAKIFGRLGTVRLPLPGKHNMQNALAALITVNQLRVSVNEAAKALESFQSTGRRFEVMGEAHGIKVINDYAHHPTAIKATLAATRDRYPGADIWAIWQPHMYSRTQRLMNDYTEAFVLADYVLITDIFAAREAPIPGVDGQTTAANIKHPAARHIAAFDDMVALLMEEVNDPAVVIIMSAGDAPQIGQKYLLRMEGNDANTSP